jgi:hypothetical protein
MALTDTKPALRSFPIVGPKASALKSATGLNARLLLVPSCADVSRRSRVSIRLTELRCHRPPKAPVIPLRFNSFARLRSVAKPAAISFRMVGSKARARGSAAPLLANAPSIPRLRDAVSARTCSIEESWPDFEATAYVKIMSNPHEHRTHAKANAQAQAPEYLPVFYSPWTLPPAPSRACTGWLDRREQGGGEAAARRRKALRRLLRPSSFRNSPTVGRSASIRNADVTTYSREQASCLDRFCGTRTYQ